LLSLVQQAILVIASRHRPLAPVAHHPHVLKAPPIHHATPTRFWLGQLFATEHLQRDFFVGLSLECARHRPPAETFAISLRCWVDIQQQFLALIVSGKWSELADKSSTGFFDNDDVYSADEYKFEFLKRAAHSALRLPIHNFPLLRSGEHVLKRLRPDDDSDLLDAASHFLAVNIAVYNHHTDHPSIDTQRELRQIVWKTDSNCIEETGLHYMAEQQSIALASGASKEFILDPSLEHDIPACNLIERKLFMEWIKVFRSKDWTSSFNIWDATPTDTKQLTYVHLAVLQPFSLDSEDQHRRDDWVKGLLERYMMASSRLRREAVARTSLADLRTIMSIILDVF
jgi:hypothetical protein